MCKKNLQNQKNSLFFPLEKRKKKKVMVAFVSVRVQSYCSFYFQDKKDEKASE
jgi:hypothetical protein